MNPEILMQLLLAMRAQIDVMLSLVRAGQEECTGCPHPEDARIDTSTMGGRRSWLCKDCGHVED